MQLVCHLSKLQKQMSRQVPWHLPSFLFVWCMASKTTVLLFYILACAKDHWKTLWISSYCWSFVELGRWLGQSQSPCHYKHPKLRKNFQGPQPTKLCLAVTILSNCWIIIAYLLIHPVRLRCLQRGSIGLITLEIIFGRYDTRLHTHRLLESKYKWMIY